MANRQRMNGPAEVESSRTGTRPEPDNAPEPDNDPDQATTWAQEPQADLMRADMVYFDVPGGGAVFATGSITFCGSLPWNRFDNNISRLLRNVVQRFLAD